MNQKPSFSAEEQPNESEREPEQESIVPIPGLLADSHAAHVSIRVYAAIQLRVPESGIERLDGMIEHSRRLDHETWTASSASSARPT